MSKFVHIQGNKLEYQLWYNTYLILKMIGGHNYSFTLPEIGQAIFEGNLSGVEQVTATEVEIMVKIDKSTVGKVIKQIESMLLSNRKHNNWLIPVYFAEGEDWTAVTEYTKTQKEHYIKNLESTIFTHAMNGFLPGFLYINGLDSSLHCPRKTSPTIKTRPNSLAIGGQYIGLYSLPSPAGWNIIGSVPINIYRKGMPPVIKPGDKIQFHPISKTEHDHLISKDLSLKQYNG